MAKVNFENKFSKFSEYWTPKVIAEMNDYQFKLVKVEGEFIWHNHPDTDEVFIGEVVPRHGVHYGITFHAFVMLQVFLE